MPPRARMHDPGVSFSLQLREDPKSDSTSIVTRGNCNRKAKRDENVEIGLVSAILGTILLSWNDPLFNSLLIGIRADLHPFRRPKPATAATLFPNRCDRQRTRSTRLEECVQE